MKLNNQSKHELGMIDDKSKDESTFERMADEFAVGRKTKYKGNRKYSTKNTSMHRARRLAKKARQERIAIDRQSIDALEHQLLFDKINKI